MIHACWQRMHLPILACLIYGYDTLLIQTRILDPVWDDGLGGPVLQESTCLFQC